MDDGARFLRPDAIIEPLVDSFYARVHSVSPTQAAMNFAFVQIPVDMAFLGMLGQHEWRW